MTNAIAHPNGPVRIASSNGQLFFTQSKTNLIAPQSLSNAYLIPSTVFPKMSNLTCNATSAAMIAMMTTAPVATQSAENDAVSAAPVQSSVQ
jgi:hypothetical protein